MGDDVVPLSSAPLFEWHRRPEIAGSLLSEYEIESVAVVQTSKTAPKTLRTMVLYAHHKSHPTLPLAIKISPVTNDERRDTFVHEQQIHYLLSQIDSPGVRQAAVSKTTGLFRADETAQHEPAVLRSMLQDINNFSIVPLYDYVIHKEPLNIGRVEGYAHYEAIDAYNGEASFLVMRRLDGLLYHAVRKERQLVECARQLYYAIMQVCSVLHLLLPIRFTHGDIHLGNLGVRTEPQKPHHYTITQKIVMRVPRDVHKVVLIDFDNSSAVMTDATNKRFDMRPSQDALNRRFADHPILRPAQTFSPMVDVFRLVENALFLLAIQITDPRSSDDRFSALEIVGKFGTVCETALTRLPDGPLKELPEFVRLLAFATALKADPISLEAVRTAARALIVAESIIADKPDELRPQNSMWWRVYAATPDVLEKTAEQLMPWDVLRLYPATTSAEAESVDLTLNCVIGRGIVYRPHKVQVATDAEIRVDPLGRAVRFSSK